MCRNEKAIRACVDFTDFQSLSLVRSKASSFAKYKGSRVTSSVLERKLTRLNSEGSNHGARNEEQGQLQRLNSQDGDELGRQPNFDGPSQIDLAISAQERFQGLTESEQELKTRSVSQDVLNLVIGGLAIAAMIFGVSLAGLPAALPLILVFSIGYLAIIFESAVDINKSSSALLMAVACWCLVGNAANLGHEQVIADLDKCLASVSQIFFFLLSAMTVVETIDAHNGFSFLTNKIRTTDKGTLLVIISSVTFFLSAVLDNLTTTIVMCSLLSRLVSDEDVETRKVRNETEHDKLEPERAREWERGMGVGGRQGGREGGREGEVLYETSCWRQVMGGMTVIAANAGGAWSPIGDVTTTMLWIEGQVTTLPLVLASPQSPHPPPAPAPAPHPPVPLPASRPPRSIRLTKTATRAQAGRAAGAGDAPLHPQRRLRRIRGMPTPLSLPRGIPPSRPWPRRRAGKRGRARTGGSMEGGWRL